MSSQMLIFTMTTELLLKIHKSMLQLIPGKNISETSKSHSSKKKKGEKKIEKEYWTLFLQQLEPIGPHCSLHLSLLEQLVLFPSRMAHFTGIQTQPSIPQWLYRPRDNSVPVPINKGAHCVDR